MATKFIPGVEKLDNSYVEDAPSKTEQAEESQVREFDPKFMRKTMLKVLRHRRIFLLDTDPRSWISSSCRS